MADPDKPIGDLGFDTKTGDLTSFAAMLGERFALQVDWLGQLLRNAHHPSLGAYKEGLLRKVISDSLPSTFSVGTGFVLFPTRHLSNTGDEKAQQLTELPPHVLSRQLDVIVYDSAAYSTIYQDGDFVVLRPEAVRSVVEVKGSLNHREVDATMALMEDFGRKWKDCRGFYKSFHGPEMKQPHLFALAWSVQTDSRQRARINCGSLRERIVSNLRKIPKTDLPAFPLLDTFLVYGDCETHSTVWMTEDSDISFGFATSRGRFIRYGPDGEPYLSGDKTIASLIARIHYSLGSHFNTAFAYVDQTRRTDVLPHERDGYKAWLTEDDVRLVSPINFEDDDWLGDA